MKQQDYTLSPSWIAVDWGTSHLRLWAMDEAHQILAERHSDKGMGTLARSEFETALLDLIPDWIANAAVRQKDPLAKLPVFACGMVGSRQGWIEAPYCTIPCAPTGAEPARLTTKDLSLFVLPGLKQMEPSDVMRGEETQIAGLLAHHPDFDGLVCLPGSHTKWVRVKDGKIQSFQTFMSGEVFAALSQHTVLRHSVESKDWDQNVFLDAVEHALANPGNLTATLFSIRADHLLKNRPAHQLKSRLSGLLIGAELAATKAHWSQYPVMLIGAQTLSKLYQDALHQQGCQAQCLDGTNMTVKGLIRAHTVMKETI
ncbi:MAG: 2-dehydro-3-deoxygalactonokinase [Cohaesibacter sp.]|nr:2-dehydro-3-deoxygalactonokinase [Cohaesibacter sp.]MCV6603431.1 2-dehydro-3-deoxygalactonokinase [Cohaesibacter sp.]